VACTVGEGRLTIVKEGSIKKLVERVDQITFSGAYAGRNGQVVLYVTERAVFELTREGVLLREIAPGVDLQRDVLDQIEFQPLIAPDLKQMDADIFTE
jgi:propionate CoA-transferase